MRNLTTTLMLGTVLWCARAVEAVDVQGVLPASLDQPRIFIAISKDLNSPPLTAKADGASLDQMMAGALGEKVKPGEEVRQFQIEAFLDTGASGIMLSKTTADGLGLTHLQTPAGAPVKFFDVGVAGEEEFGVTVPYVVRYCDYGGNSDGDAIGRYQPAVNGQTIRLKVRTSSSLIDQLTGGMDVAGMPVMWGKVMVVDVKPVSDLEKLKTSIVPPGDKSIPKPDSVVPLTYIDFTRFTRMEPAGASAVSLAPNPMIGPDPFNKADRAQPVVVTHHGKQARMTMLLDTGATSSFISIAKARELGIDVDDDGTLKNVPAKEQFTLPIGGIGGSKDVHGFYVDSLQLPVAQGEPARWIKAPVMVMDVTVTDPKSKQQYTLDGVFGMNYLVPSANISVGGAMGADISNMQDGAFDAFTVDHVGHTLGLTLKK